MKFVARFSHTSMAMLALLAIACAGNSPPPESSGPPPEKVTTTDDGNAPAVRTKMTPEECKAKGTLVGDIGDGATQRANYRCPDGKAPLGNVASGIEGAVCCPR